MPKNFQNINISRQPMQNNILDLEKKYFSMIENILKSDAFQNDLLLIEKEIRENYSKFKETWDLKNKIKVPAERVIRHHIYLGLNEYIRGIYPSPISSDMGIRMDDCILCIDSKTIDTENNAGDIRATSAEPNQISFDNSNHRYIKALHNLESMDHYFHDLPVLTFVIKIIYTDNNYRFELSRTRYPSVVLCCIPNGEISNLFDKDIVQNFKTYDYYDVKDGEHFKPIPIPSNCTTAEQKNDFAYQYCVTEKGFMRVDIELERGSKAAYFDAPHNCYWWVTSKNNKPVIQAFKSGSSLRVWNDVLRDRFDSNNQSWQGYKEISIPEPLP